MHCDWFDLCKACLSGMDIIREGITRIEINAVVLSANGSPAPAVSLNQQYCRLST
jgi:hypothetical protein